MTKFICFENTQPITAIYAVISVDKNGEGICASGVEGEFIIPLIATTDVNLARLREAAKKFTELAKGTDKQIKLIKMTVREELEI